MAGFSSPSGIHSKETNPPLFAKKLLPRRLPPIGTEGPKIVSLPPPPPPTPVPWSWYHRNCQSPRSRNDNKHQPSNIKKSPRSASKKGAPDELWSLHVFLKGRTRLLVDYILHFLSPSELEALVQALQFHRTTAVIRVACQPYQLHEGRPNCVTDDSPLGDSEKSGQSASNTESDEIVPNTVSSELNSDNGSSKLSAPEYTEGSSSQSLSPIPPPVIFLTCQSYWQRLEADRRRRRAVIYALLFIHNTRCRIDNKRGSTSALKIYGKPINILIPKTIIDAFSDADMAKVDAGQLRGLKSIAMPQEKGNHNEAFDIIDAIFLKSPLFRSSKSSSNNEVDLRETEIMKPVKCFLQILSTNGTNARVSNNFSHIKATATNEKFDPVNNGVSNETLRKSLSINNIEEATTAHGVSNKTLHLGLSINNIEEATTAHGVSNKSLHKSLSINNIEEATTAHGVSNETLHKSLSINNIEVATNAHGVSNETLRKSLSINNIEEATTAHGVSNETLHKSLSINNIEEATTAHGISNKTLHKSLSINEEPMNANEETNITLPPVGQRLRFSENKNQIKATRSPNDREIINGSMSGKMPPKSTERHSKKLNTVHISNGAGAPVHAWVHAPRCRSPIATAAIQPSLVVEPTMTPRRLLPVPCRRDTTIPPITAAPMGIRFRPPLVRQPPVSDANDEEDIVISGAPLRSDPPRRRLPTPGYRARHLYVNPLGPSTTAGRVAPCQNTLDSTANVNNPLRPSTTAGRVAPCQNTLNSTTNLLVNPLGSSTSAGRVPPYHNKLNSTANVRPFGSGTSAGRVPPYQYRVPLHSTANVNPLGSNTSAQPARRLPFYHNMLNSTADEPRHLAHPFRMNDTVIEMWLRDIDTKEDVVLRRDLHTLVSDLIKYQRMYHSLLQESQMSEFLLQVAQAIFEEMVSLDQLIKKILEVAQRLVSADRASLFLVDHKNLELVSTVFDLRYETTNDNDFSKKEIRMPINKGIAGHVAMSGETMNIPDAYSDERFNKAVDEATGYRTVSILCMPIKLRGKVIAVVQMVNKRDKEAFGNDDEAAFRVFSTFFGLALHHARLYDKIKRKEQKYKVALEVLGYHNTCAEEDVANLLEAKEGEKINYNDFALNPFEVDDVAKCKGILSMFDDLFDMSKFDVPVLARFVLTVKKNYRKVPYHNFDHGWAVANAMYVMLKHDTENRFDYNNRLALFVACLCHDLDHRGYTNKFMSEIASPLATIYTTSTLEHHHFNMTVTILQQDGHNIFNHMSSDGYKDMLDSIRQCILATDLATFFPNLKKINELVFETPQFDWNNVNHSALGRSFAMTCADLCAAAKPFEVQLVTAEIITAEFYQQGDLERQAGRTPMPMMDRSRPEELPACQVGFLSQICLPCYTVLSELFPTTEPMLSMTKQNLEIWKARASEIESKNKKD